jgi:hypothetical protein
VAELAILAIPVIREMKEKELEEVVVAVRPFWFGVAAVGFIIIALQSEMRAVKEEQELMEQFLVVLVLMDVTVLPEITERLETAAMQEILEQR